MHQDEYGCLWKIAKARKIVTPMGLTSLDGEDVKGKAQDVLVVLGMFLDCQSVDIIEMIPITYPPPFIQ